MKTSISLKTILLNGLLGSVILLSACSKSKDDPAPAPVEPTLTTSAATSITSTTAVLAGNVTSLGNQTITFRGAVFATNSNPTTSDNFVSASGSGLGPYTTEMARFLIPNTTYHFRAVIQTTTGITYGNDLTFKTLP